MYGLAYMIHFIGALILILLVVLPFLAFIKGRKGEPLPGHGFWRKLIMACNFSLIVAIVSGITMFPYFNMGRTWVALLLTVTLGATLGIMAKGLKTYQRASDNEFRGKALMKVAYVGFGYLLILLGILYMMSKWYFL